MTQASRPFRETQKRLLQDPETAALYLEEARAAGNAEALRLARRNVDEARREGMSKPDKAVADRDGAGDLP